MAVVELSVFFCFQAEDGIRDLVRSRGLGDVYKRQVEELNVYQEIVTGKRNHSEDKREDLSSLKDQYTGCLLYTSDAADERYSVDLGGRRIIKQKKHIRD